MKQQLPQDNGTFSDFDTVEPMNIVHLSTFDTGGAATAALRLHHGLLATGVSSAFLSLHTKFNHQQEERFRFPKTVPPLYKRIAKYFGLPLSRQDQINRRVQKLDGKYEVFSLPYAEYRVELHPLVRNADLIHLHWVAGFINYPTFFSQVNKPIIWTLHDMNPFMGGFHYNIDKQRNPQLEALEKSLRRIKVETIREVANLYVVTPSQWLGQHSTKSEVFSRQDHFHIPYGLDVNTFRPFPREVSRDVLGLPPSGRILLFVSERTDNFRKGLDILKDALTQIQIDPDVRLVSIGVSEQHGDDNILSFGPVWDDRLLALIFSAADVVILPSREDNFPNVMLEALACGTPVISFSNGGMKEVIRTGFNGILVEETTSDALRAAIVQFLEGTFTVDRTAIRQYAVENFRLDLQASRYHEIYKQVIG